MLTGAEIDRLHIAVYVHGHEKVPAGGQEFSHGHGQRCAGPPCVVNCGQATVHGKGTEVGYFEELHGQAEQDKADAAEALKVQQYNRCQTSSGRSSPRSSPRPTHNTPTPAGGSPSTGNVAPHGRCIANLTTRPGSSACYPTGAWFTNHLGTPTTTRFSS